MKVYISHAASERALAEDLASQLTEAGFETWSDSMLFPGDNWHLQIGQALEQAEAMIVLVSPESAASEWVRNEIQHALGSLQYENRVIPVQVRATAGMPWILRRFPSIPGEGGAVEIGRRVLDRLRESSEVAR